MAALAEAVVGPALVVGRRPAVDPALVVGRPVVDLAPGVALGLVAPQAQPVDQRAPLRLLGAPRLRLPRQPVLPARLHRLGAPRLEG